MDGNKTFALHLCRLPASLWQGNPNAGSAGKFADENYAVYHAYSIFLYPVRCTIRASHLLDYVKCLNPGAAGDHQQVHSTEKSCCRGSGAKTCDCPTKKEKEKVNGEYLWYTNLKAALKKKR